MCGTAASTHTSDTSELAPPEKSPEPDEFDILGGAIARTDRHAWISLMGATGSLLPVPKTRSGHDARAMTTSFVFEP